MGKILDKIGLTLKKSISQFGQIFKIAIISTKIMTPIDQTNTLGAKYDP
jgi:hypothetical protein